MKDEDLFRVNDLDGDEVIVYVIAVDNVKQDATVAEKEVSAAADEVVTTAERVEGITAATTPQISKADATLSQTLIEIKAAKPRARGVIVQEPSKFRKLSSSQPSQLPQAKDKGKGIVAEPKKPLKKKDQIAFDEEVARKLDAQMKAEIEEEERIAREKHKANKVVIKEWDDVQAIIDADRRLAEQLQAQEKERLSIKERSELFAKLIEFRRKYFAAKRAKEIRNKPPTKAQQKSLMFPEDDDDVTIKATPLSSKSPTIVDYKIYKERKKSYFKIIRVDGNSQNYLTFGTMFKNFNKEDLEVLWSIMKERFKNTKPLNDMVDLLFQTLKTMFEHHVEDNIWKYQQREVKVYNWKLYGSCRVYYVTTHYMVYYLLVEKMYPFTNNILHQLWNEGRLQVDYEVEMAYDLLRLIRRQINEGYIPA
nr:hypothetical protein [Tanacetum cinerariifolium]